MFLTTPPWGVLKLQVHKTSSPQLSSVNSALFYIRFTSRFKQGQKGQRGTTGADGRPGQPGHEGLTGPQGGRGLEGERGLTGPPGPRGLPVSTSFYFILFIWRAVGF